MLEWLSVVVCCGCECEYLGRVWRCDGECGWGRCGSFEWFWWGWRVWGCFCVVVFDCCFGGRIGCGGEGGGEGGGVKVGWDGGIDCEVVWGGVGSGEEGEEDVGICESGGGCKFFLVEDVDLGGCMVMRWSLLGLGLVCVRFGIGCVVEGGNCMW